VRARSLPLGALRLTERHLHSDPIAPAERRALERQIDAAVARVLAPFRRVPASQIDLVASGGSVTTALAMLAPRARRATTARISRSDIVALANTCFAKTLSQRKRLPGLPADRADIIPAGLAVVNAFLSQSGKRVLSVNDGGLREGVLIAIDAEFEAIDHERAHRHSAS
jgi:exopolyphosphatase/guanosine-5'-triphosphate,3'-diphosphate pyrophosphatase